MGILDAPSFSLPRWRSGVFYRKDTQVVSPDNDIVKSLADHLSGTTFNPNNWTGSGTLPAQIQAQVNSVLASNSAPVSAATSAVNNALSQAGVFNGAFPVVNNDTLLFSITDSAGNRSWIEVGADGLPTTESANAIATAINSQLNTAVDNRLSTKPIFQTTTPGSGVAVAFVDQNDQRSWLEVADDGGPTDNSISLIQSKLNIQSAPASTKPSYGSEVIKVASGPDVVLWGDSMTAAGWDVYLAPAISRTVYKCGVGGETSAGIAARQGALPYLMVANGGSIPASGGVIVTFTTASSATSWPLLQGAGTPDGKMMGTLAGVAGQLTLTQPTAPGSTHNSDDYYTFTRTTPGTAVTLNRPTAFIPDNAVLRRSDIAIIWAGRNNFSQSNGDQAFNDIKAMTRYLSALDKRFLVLSVHNGTGEGTGTTNYPLITGLNARLQAEYGRRFVDHRTYLVQYGLQDAGITPTAQDNADVAADTVPVSLRQDTIHQNDAGKQITAKQVELRLREMGWV